VTAVASIEQHGVSGARGSGLSLGHFRCVARNGFGDPSNSYAWSGVWYDDHVYIGTITHLLVTLQRRISAQMVWPVPRPAPDEDPDLRGQIWRYSPRTQMWQRVFQSPLVVGLRGRPTPLATGFRNMSVFQGKGDCRPAIYTIPSCNRDEGLGPVVLRSEDGLHFEPVSQPGLTLADTNVNTFRGNVAFKGRLFIAPSGSRSGQSNVSYNSVVLCSDEPAHGAWVPSNQPGFGDPTNYGIFDLGVCGDFLYAGTVNVREGCQLWKTDAEGPPPHRWTRVFDRGADRGPHNQLIMSMASFKGCLYVGTGIQNGGHDRLYNVGPDAGEVIRVFPDDTWDLVVGQPRITRQGLKIPASGLGPGFENPLAGYIWRITAHDGCLYVGTYDASCLIPFSNSGNWPAWLGRMLDANALDRFLRVRGGCELWRTADGIHWSAVTRNGFGNPYNWGVRSLISTPVGLFAGTANPFGPTVARNGPAGWRYEPNQQGGCEIWHGAAGHAVISDNAASSASMGAAEWSRDYGAMPFDQLLAMAELRAGPAADLDTTPADQTLAHVMRQAFEAAGGGAAGSGNAMHQAPAATGLGTANPLHALARENSQLVGLSSRLEDELKSYLGAAGPACVGYWQRGQDAPRGAAAALARELLLLLRPQLADGARRLAAVGCAADLVCDEARQLLPSILLTPATLKTSAAGWLRKPVTYRLLDATTDKPLAEQSIDGVICIEATCQPDRPLRLKALARVLKPGGCLVLADFLGEPRFGRAAPQAPREAAALREALDLELAESGFQRMRQLVDATEVTWLRFSRHSQQYLATKRLFQQLTEEERAAFAAALPGGNLVVAAYVLAVART
jgi:SAM-dependent methyltransferase